ncbi:MULTISPECIES: Uma2 family endonuclease [Thiorhodovibrio]|uniref:Uma2 family endonuclease n=1 Tax=Thiorhodovibrio TaxID=61593 RepID=UPI0019141C6B|nr:MULTISPECIES: Uma2 family endonuclease [Thiorhodovibrio]MBK5969671.1 hypothetical protein [Thiorhodovibrio winogradskyi]WPL14524.1 hypothetical protein Thiosp_04370 [Thiorhodovibrio litoralis]
MPALAYQLTPYDHLEALPEGLTGEILNGQLHTQPRPSGRHGRASVLLDRALGRSYDDGDAGPGGWWILIEPEVHFIRDTEVAVPDLAGWRRERMPQIPDGHRFEVVPDWVCEILSASTESKDRNIKMPLYAHYGVPHAWLLDPRQRRLEAYALETQGEQPSGWRLLLEAGGTECVQAPPFSELALELDALWV